MWAKNQVLVDLRAKFVLVGLLNTVVGFSIFTGLYLLFSKELNYLVILCISQSVAIVFSHNSQRNLVWKTKGPYFPELLKFSMAYIVISVANFILLRIAVDLFNFPVLKSQYVISILLISLAYIIQKLWVFVNSNHDPSDCNCAHS